MIADRVTMQQAALKIISLPVIFHFASKQMIVIIVANFTEIVFCRQQEHAVSKTLRQQNPTVLNWRCQLTQVDLYNRIMVVKRLLLSSSSLRSIFVLSVLLKIILHVIFCCVCAI